MIALLSAGNSPGGARVDLFSLQRGVFLRPLAPALPGERLFVFADKLAQLAAQQD
ncbi:MAG: hypothetical protein ACREEM_20255 [Blastocatellia bacterium]